MNGGLGKGRRVFNPGGCRRNCLDHHDIGSASIVGASPFRPRRRRGYSPQNHHPVGHVRDGRTFCQTGALDIKPLSVASQLIRTRQRMTRVTLTREAGATAAELWFC
jgi:hypothetical protein